METGRCLHPCKVADDVTLHTRLFFSPQEVLLEAHSISCPPFLPLLIIRSPVSVAYMHMGVRPSTTVSNLPEAMSPKEGVLSPSAAIS